MEDNIEKTLAFYSSVLKTEKQAILLEKIKKVLSVWFEYVKDNIMDEKRKTFFINSLNESNEMVWSEIGMRLAKHWINNLSVKEIFENVLHSNKAQGRFNITALSNYFPKEYEKEILLRGLEDKSKRIRIKASDQILMSQNENLLEIIKIKLKLEKDYDVQKAYNFAINYFDKVEIRSDGSKEINC